MELTTLWFILVAVLFAGYFMLEGFDFGVGMLVGLLAKNDKERRVLINTIGPVWDGNEVWILTGGGALFAAFPEWYATLFSAMYLPLFLILVGLIVRGVAFEYRGKQDGEQWKRGWDWAIVVGSFLPALLWGVAVGNIANFVKTELISGGPGSGTFEGVGYVGNFFDLLNPYSLLAGVVTLTVFLTHGAMFAAMKTSGDLRVRAHKFALYSGLVAAVATVAFLGWTIKKMYDVKDLLAGVDAGLGFPEGTFFDALGRVPIPVLIGMAVAVALFFVAGLVAAFFGKDGWAFAGTALAIVTFTFFAFAALFPFVLPAAGNGETELAGGAILTNNTVTSSLTTQQFMTPPLPSTPAAEELGVVGAEVPVGVSASSTPLTLKIMTGVAVIMTPIVVAYQAWSYWVFRKRISVDSIPETATTSA